jgi:SAM-dependent methyltransferase
MNTPRFHEPGGHTSYGGILNYRLGKLEEFGVIRGAWLDLGCADGYYASGLAERGAETVVGLELNPEVVARASGLPHPENVSFLCGQGELLPFEDGSFDCVLLNEVLEHVFDEHATLREVHRVLRSGGTLAVFSPNRWFPFEGHGARWSSEHTLSRRPVPFMPWLPSRIANRVAVARNYWPHELTQLVSVSGLTVVTQGWALAQFDRYRWLPRRAADWYRRNTTRIERSPLARFCAVSTFILAKKL